MGALESLRVAHLGLRLNEFERVLNIRVEVHGVRFRERGKTLGPFTQVPVRFPFNLQSFCAVRVHGEGCVTIGNRGLRTLQLQKAVRPSRVRKRGRLAEQRSRVGFYGTAQVAAALQFRGFFFVGTSTFPVIAALGRRHGRQRLGFGLHALFVGFFLDFCLSSRLENSINA